MTDSSGLTQQQQQCAQQEHSTCVLHAVDPNIATQVFQRQAQETHAGLATLLTNFTFCHGHAPPHTSPCSNVPKNIIATSRVPIGPTLLKSTRHFLACGPFEISVRLFVVLVSFFSRLFVSFFLAYILCSCMIYVLVGPLNSKDGRWVPGHFYNMRILSHCVVKIQG